MLNGRCKVWKDESGNYHAELALDTPNGVIKMNRSAALTDSVGSWDPRAPETGPGTLIKKKVEYIAGFFPLENAVGDKATQTAAELLKRYTDEQTRAAAERDIVALKQAASDGDDFAFDVDYALRRMTKGAKRTQVGSAYSRGVMAQGIDTAETNEDFDVHLSAPQTEIGFKPFKKLAKWAKKNPVKAVASAVFPPAAAFIAVRELRNNRPAAIEKVAAVRLLAAGKPAEPGLDAPPQPVVEQAQAAVENLRKADAFMEEGYFPSPAEVAAQNAAFDAYEQEDAVGGPFDFIKKAVGKALATVDPSKPGSFTKPLLSNLPFVGPGIKASLDLLDQAKKLNPSAIEKVKTVKSLADAGVPKAKEALSNLQTAQALSKEAEKAAAQAASTGKASKVGKLHNWFPFIDLYRAGLTKGV